MSVSNSLGPNARSRWTGWIDQNPTRAATLASWGYQLVNVGATMILAPILLVRFGADDAGVWFFLLGCVTFFQLCDFGIGMSVSRQIAYSGREPEVGMLPEGSTFIPMFGARARHEVFLTARHLFSRIAWVMLGLAIVAERSVLFAGHMSISVEARLTWYLVVAAGLGYFLARPYQVYLEGLLLQARERILVLLVTIASNVVLLTVVLVWPRLWVMGLAFAFGGWLQYATTAMLARRSVLREYWSQSAFPRGLLHQLWSASWEQGITSIGIYFIISINPILIGWLLGPSGVSEYYLPWRAANAAQTALIAIFLPHLPFMIDAVRRGAHGEVKARLKRLFALGMPLAIAGYGAFILLGPTLIHWWLRGTMTVQRPVLAGLAIWHVLGVVQTVCWLYVVAYGIQRFAHWIIAGAVLNVLLSIWMIPRWGVLGSVVATAVAQLATSNWYTVWRAWTLSKTLGVTGPHLADTEGHAAAVTAGAAR